MDGVEEDQQQQQQEQPQREDESEEEGGGGGGGGSAFLTPSFPLGRVKKIMKLDRDIQKVNTEALLLVSLAADLFLGSLAERARDAALSKKRRTIKLDHLSSAVRAHPPASDFLLDCLPQPPPAAPASAARTRPSSSSKPLPPGARRIEDFFSKPSTSAAPSSSQ